ncbi:phosphoenolpyruvate synthase [Exilibacterium tricleocarpae]|uniref:Phosphoenolpyruvate synthase n=1 Tax=Exilibacterium tricleocarpae TaxID=2591008 RepID=A0A545TV69_9GAMM|nr:phosphoenolpyruvate synthase [Exilibacterium tricleocarpae]TQV81113.1 phosphoenolpyruvate synthase [Exilibacterium tricleocarpae]
MPTDADILWFEQLNLDDIARVGGKNASLGEMLQAIAEIGINVPAGFAISAQVYRDFIDNNSLQTPIDLQLEALTRGEQGLTQTGAAIRQLIGDGEFSAAQAAAIGEAYERLCAQGETPCSVAVRSSATAEDLPEASFAGQQESYLNVSGNAALLEACRDCFASLYTDRAIVYREEQGFAHQQVAISVGVQKMVRSDLACAGVMFTLDTESGFPDAVLISGAWGLGETVVKGRVNPDRYMVYKPLLDDGSPERVGLKPIIEKSRGSKLEKMIYGAGSSPTLIEATNTAEQIGLTLSDAEVLTLARWGCRIEKHYGRPMDIEWAKDGVDGKLYIVQARPETIESQKDRSVLVSYKLKEQSTVLLQGASVGSAIATGPVYYTDNPKDVDGFPDGALLVTERTDPDWVPLMRKAAGIITDSGGTTSHAAIVSRELKVPAVVGTGNATRSLQPGAVVTLSCAEGAVGKIYAGELAYETHTTHVDEIPATRTQLMINAAIPDGALSWWKLPVAGIGLTRIEFIISTQIRVHPMALLHPQKITRQSVTDSIEVMTRGYDNPAAYFVDNLAQGIGKIAASRYPHPVIVRMSDFKSNEYRGLLGGEFFEIEEDNPMLGLRGASRYYHPLYREAFQLECQAIKYVREQMGFDNVVVMIPFCRTPGEADRVLETMATAGLVRGERGLQVYVMCEIPSNVILADEFARRFDGFSIGSNDLTQLVLGIDRDSAELKDLFDARDEAVKRMIEQVIVIAHQHDCKVGICGQAPSEHPEYAAFLVHCGIDSISLNPDSIVAASQFIAAAEREEGSDQK